VRGHPAEIEGNGGVDGKPQQSTRIDRAIDVTRVKKVSVDAARDEVDAARSIIYIGIEPALERNLQ